MGSGSGSGWGEEHGVEGEKKVKKHSEFRYSLGTELRPGIQVEPPVPCLLCHSGSLELSRHEEWPLAAIPAPHRQAAAWKPG